ncbi:hypothetical protein WJX84_009472 [Apatococcus fuscideae]|uniref:Uncharacterized protein n=1 Tax=Apatococcus fuscideae TaxID=2026836 RepID=A0AAW1TJ09_9CHLO
MLEQVTSLLIQTVGPERTAKFLDRDTPGKVHFGNRVSAQQHAGFMTQEIRQLRSTGTLPTWQEAGLSEPPMVTHGIGVVENRKGKLRLIVDARYLNLFILYVLLHYENLQDAIYQLQQGHFMWTTVLKSGYHQIPMHRDTWKYLGIESGGTIYVMPYLPFGVASACREYTDLMGAVYKPLRSQGEKLAYLIDDALGAAQDQPTANYHALTIYLLLSALGFFLSVHKCQLYPATVALFLGMTLNTIPGLTKVPDEKLQYLAEQFTRLSQQGQATPRGLAKAAGTLMSFKPGMPIAPLYTRGFYQAMAGRIETRADWGRAAPLESLSLEDMQWWADNLLAANGSRQQSPSRVACQQA